MAKVTKISLQKNQKRFNIFLDDKYGFSLTGESLAEFGLSVGQEIDKKRIKTLISKNEFQKTLDRTMRFISFRPRSINETRRYLEGKLRGKKQAGFLVEKVINRLVKLNFLDDKEFVKWWVGQRAEFRPRGKMAIKFELKQKGISDDLVRRVVENELDEINLAKKVLSKKISAIKRLPAVERRRKVAAMLSRRGFSWQTIKEAVKSMGD